MRGEDEKITTLELQQRLKGRGTTLFTFPRLKGSNSYFPKTFPDVFPPLNCVEIRVIIVIIVIIHFPISYYLYFNLPFCF